MLNKNVKTTTMPRLQAALNKYKKSNRNSNKEKNYKKKKLALIHQAIQLYKSSSEINYTQTLLSILKRINNNK